MIVKKLVLKNKFNIGDIVFHEVSGEKGLVTMVRIVVDSTHCAVYEYYIAAGMAMSTWASEMELTLELIYN